jgi:hypothetical protein
MKIKITKPTNVFFFFYIVLIKEFIEKIFKVDQIEESINFYCDTIIQQSLKN